jgi:hypothetical protein
MATVWTFEVVGKDCQVQLRDDNTFYDLIDIICKVWLDDARDGDGGVDDHLWTIDGNYSEDEFNFTPLVEMRLLQPGRKLQVMYDFGSTTCFSVQVVESVELSEEEARTCPREKPSSHPHHHTVSIYVPPEGTPDLDELFPKASELLFQSAAQWFVLFPCNKGIAGFVEAGPNAMGDLVFMPDRFPNVEELLISLNEAGKRQPEDGTREDAFARFVFPASLMSEQDEKKYKTFKKEFDEFEAALVRTGVRGNESLDLTSMSAMGLSEEHVYRMMGPKDDIIRLTMEEMTRSITELREKHFDFDKVFPKSSAAFESKEYLWFSYRRGKLMVSKGKCSGERGIPRKSAILATAQCKIDSLQELFCTLENMWPESIAKRKRSD